MFRLFTLILFGLSLALNAFSQNDLPLQTASYLGGAGNDEAHGVGIQSTDHLVIAGKIDDLAQNYSLTPHNLALGSTAAGGKGVILRLSPDGQTLLSIARMAQNGAVEDMALHPSNDKIAVIGPSGFGLMNAAGDAMLWSENGGSTTTTPIYSSGRRVDIGSDGTVAALYNTGADAQIHIYDELGNPISGGVLNVLETDIGGGTYNERYEDIAVDAANQLVIVTGTAQRCTNYQTSFLMAYSYATATFGTQVWKSYTWWCSAASAHASADTRGIRVSMGENGDLLFTGYAHGGNNFLRYVANSNVLPPVAEPNLTDIDTYTNFSGSQVSGYSSAFVARMNPADGSVIKSQFHHNRNTSGQKTTFRATAVAGDASGNVIFGGTGAAHFINRTSLTVNSAPTGAYTGGEGYFVELASDFNSRNQLGCLTEMTNGGASEIVALAARGTRRVAVCTTNGRLFTSNPIQNTVTSGWGGDTDIYFAFWGGPTEDADFAGTPLTLTEGQTVTFTDASVGATSWNWTFSGGTPASATGVGPHVVTYPNAGIYDATLSINGGSNTETKTGYITVNPPGGPQTCTPVPEVTLSAPTVVGSGTPASCTEAALVAAIAGGGHISFNSGGSPVTITLTSELTITSNTVIDGGNLVTLDGNNVTRILNKPGGPDLTVQNLRFINANAPDPSTHFSNTCGGAILAKGSGNLDVIDCEFENNQTQNTTGADIAGGAIYIFNVPQTRISGSVFRNNISCNGGAVGNLGGDLLIFNSLIENNQAVGLASSGPLRGHGGAIYIDGVDLSGLNKRYTLCGVTLRGNQGDTQGGATYSVFTDNTGSVAEFEKCHFENNQLVSTTAGQGGAVFHMEDGHVGAGASETNFEITACTFDQNSAFAQGGGVWTLINGQVNIINSTFSQNTLTRPSSPPPTPAGGQGGGLAISQGVVLVQNCTFSENFASLMGGGIQIGGTNQTTLANCIFDRNLSEINWQGYQVNRDNCIDGGGNIQFPVNRPVHGTADRLVTPTVVLADPLLLPLAQNGGPTPTHALDTGSPAIDAGANCASAPPADQRGTARVGACDMGAFEYTGATTPCLPDVTPPTLTFCPTNQSFTDGIDNTISGTGLDATATDNCTLSSLTNDFNGGTTLNGATFPVGTTTVAWTATDAAGNTMTCSFDVVVAPNPCAPDVTPPTLTFCPSNQNLTENVDNTISGTALDATATDNCTLSSLINDFNGGTTLNGATFPVGTTTVAWTATDAAGNTMTCSFDVVVAPDCSADITPPNYTYCPSDTVLTLGFNSTVTGTWLDATATDNCTLTAVLNSETGSASLDGHSFPVGTTSVRWRAIDAAGNIQTCTYDVTVTTCATDTIAPTFDVCPRDTVLTDGINSSISGTWLDATASDNCGLTSFVNDYTGTASLDGVSFPLGSYAITWIAEDGAGNQSACVVEVNVIGCASGDVLAPNLTCPPNANFTENVDNTISGMGLDANATDNCTLASLTNDFNGGTSLNSETFPAGTTTVTWTAIDAAGNTTICTFDVIVAPDPCNTDAVAPTLTCPLNANFTENVDNTVLGTGLDASATDNCTLSSLTNDFNGGTSLNSETFPAGTTTVTWTAIDAAGNTTICTFDVTVAPDPCTTDAVSPTFTTCPTNITLTDGQSNTISGTGLDALATDNCNLASLTNDFNSGATLDGETFALGTTTVTWTATDDLGNAATCSFDVEVIPNLAPTLNNFGVITTLDNPFSFSASHFSSNFTDPNGDVLAELEIISLPTNGTLTLGGAPVSVGDVILAANLGSLMYTPNAGYLGTDSFQWNAQDGLLYAATAATATITIYQPASGGGGGGTPVFPVINPPTDLVAIAQNTTTIELTWRDRSNDEDGYEVYRRAPNGTFTRIATLTADAITYTDTGLNPDTEYAYYVVVLLGTQSEQSNTAAEFTYPEAPTTQGVQVCADSSALLSAQGTHQSGLFAWYADSASTNILASDSLFRTPALRQNDTFYVASLGEKYESQTRTALPVTLLPPPSLRILDSSYRETCDNSLLLVAEGTQIVRWQWFKDGQALQGDTSAQLIATTSGRYSVWGIDGQCAAQSNEVELVLNPKPTAQILGASLSEYCGIAALQALIEQNISYRWLDTAGNELSQSANLLAQQSGVYFLEATSPEGCTAYDTAQIQIYDPSVFITFPDTLFRCAADTFIATAPQQAGFRFAWETPTGLRYTSDTLQLSPNEAPEGNYLLLITDTTRNCTVADTFFLRVSPVFDFILETINPTCVSYEDGHIQLETTQALRVWLDGQELQAEDSLGQFFRKDSLRAGVYLLELENSDSCHYAEEILLEDPLPMEVTANPTESIITRQEQAQLQASGAYTYTWYPAAGLSDPNSSSPLAQPDSTTTYTVIGSNEVGCTDTAQVTVFVVGLEDLLPSRVISPNGDNINDTWEILNLEKFPGLRVRVFNRWGQEVFASDNYDNTWPGRAPNGEVLPVGAYYFILTLPDGSSRQGHVNLVY